MRVSLLPVLFVVLASIAAPAGAETDVAEQFETSFAHEARGDYAAALGSVRSVLKTEPGNYTATLRAGWMHYLRAEHEEAAVWYRKAAALAPSSIEPKLGLMLPLMAALRWKEAEAVANEVLKASPQNFLANSRLAFILFSQGKYTAAKAEYQKMTELYPGDLDMQLGMGWTLQRMGDKKGAGEWFTKILRVRRTHAGALEGLELLKR